ncbi:hypothetical protein RUE5091_00140 [Ruegeria denitrificans]|uniref:Uncharacterized protein n=1 Tax=Ruegeria denitrificans TaxID=1715692 RepID=A0A0P1I103_9RHOB|nr:hypothetical protein [Ruegeria denitrificans]CUJ83716.1 hypothetical protein RUE5091_00140 [Ruegeria denitrificans]
MTQDHTNSPNRDPRAVNLAYRAQETGDQQDISKAANAANAALFEALDAIKILIDVTGYSRLENGLELIMDEVMLHGALADLEEGIAYD